MLSLDPPIFLIENFLNASEVDLVRELSEQKFVPSGGVGSTSAEYTLSFRTSHSAFLDRPQEFGSPVEAIELRGQGVCGAPYIESLQVVRYSETQCVFPSSRSHTNMLAFNLCCSLSILIRRYDGHYDWFTQSPGSCEAIGVDGQRTSTFFVYLDTLPSEAEGETQFFKLDGLKVRPRRGAAYVVHQRCP